MKTQIKVSDTRYPRLTRAVLRRMDRDSLEDVCRHGADAGFPGFTYNADTVAFFKAHKAEILAMTKADSEEFGMGMLEMVAGFNCLKSYKLDATEVSAGIYEPDSEHATVVRNALAWYALESVARELNPDL